MRHGSVKASQVIGCSKNFSGCLESVVAKGKCFATLLFRNYLFDTRENCDRTWHFPRVTIGARPGGGCCTRGTKRPARWWFITPKILIYKREKQSSLFTPHLPREKRVSFHKMLQLKQKYQECQFQIPKALRNFLSLFNKLLHRINKWILDGKISK